MTTQRAKRTRKGWVSIQPNAYCRHVIRFTLAGYHESLLSVAYPGDRHGYEYCKPAMQQLLGAWPWTPEQRRQIIIRSDAEQGTDENLAYLLWCNFQILMKGYSGQRTQAWVKRTPDTAWQVDPDDPERWAAPAPVPLRLGHRVRRNCCAGQTPRKSGLMPPCSPPCLTPSFSNGGCTTGGAPSKLRSAPICPAST